MDRFECVSVKRISPARNQLFFGYYDLQPWSENGKIHLVHRTDFADRLQVKGDKCEIGALENGVYRKITETLAWNFQQGAMLQWNPLCDKEIIYNDVVGDTYKAVVMNIQSGEKRFLSRAVANVSKCGKYGLSVNFSRMYDFRPGYGYAFFEDSFRDVNHPKDDGVFLVDMLSGSSELVISLDEIWKLTGKYFDEDKKLVINHITFSPDASKFMLLCRNFPNVGKPHRTCVVVCGRNGENPVLMCDYCYFSHYWWQDNNRIIAFSDGDGTSVGGKITNYIYNLSEKDGVIMSTAYFSDEDNHMSLDASGRYMLNDTYPDKNRIQSLCVYDTEKDENIFLGGFYSPEVPIIDIRCDLHPRWSRDGRKITFDSTHEGFRGVYEIDFGDILK